MTAERWYCPARDCLNNAIVVADPPPWPCPTCGHVLFVVPAAEYGCDACGQPTARAGFCVACEGHDLSLDIVGGSALREGMSERW